MADARFEDGAERPLHLVARDADDLAVVSALIQDAVFPITEMRWQKGRRRLALLVNRFRWEDREAAARAGRGYERVQALLVIDEALSVQSQGIDRLDRDTVLSLMSVTFQPGTEGAGRLLLVLAGDGAIALEVEALEVTLKDVTRPYLAPSGKVPQHGT
jgi:hypothetical protein